jgi:hypothetical protein
VGFLEDVDNKMGPLPDQLQFDENGEVRVAFTVAPEMAGRLVFDVTEDATDCIAGRVWFVEPAAPDTSTEEMMTRPIPSPLPVTLVFLLSLGLISVRIRSRSTR